MRHTLNHERIDKGALKKIQQFHPDGVSEVEKAIKDHEWVVVGMRHNPVVSSARKHLTALNIPFHYIEHGSYFSSWKKRLAIKLWSGWPTFPQVFHKGVLIGGFDDLKVYRPLTNKN
jgi:monothiol glutaredoxin